MHSLASRPRQRSQMKEGSSKLRDCSGNGSRTRSGDACRTCGRSGKNGHHPRSYCPATEATCRRCGKDGHFEAVCLSTKHKDDTKVWKLHNRRVPRAQEQRGFHDFMAKRDRSRSQDVDDHRNDSTNRASNPKRKSNPKGAKSPVNSSTKGRDDVAAAPELERRPGTMRTVRLGTAIKLHML